MTDLLHFPDDETKAFRRARAEAVVRAERGAWLVAAYALLLDDLMAARPGRDGRYPAPGLALWIADAHALLYEIKRAPAPVRMDAAITGRCLKLKGLVDEAQMESFAGVPAADLRSDGAARAAIAEVKRATSGPGLSAMEIARRENEALTERLNASRTSSARRAPDAPASLTPGLLSRSPQLSGGALPAAGKTARAATPPSSPVAARAVLMAVVGRSVGTLLRPSRLLLWLFHAARMRLARLFVTGKRNGDFSQDKRGRT